MKQDNVPAVRLDSNLNEFLKSSMKGGVKAKVTSIKKNELMLDFDGRAIFGVTHKKDDVKVGDVLTFDLDGKAVGLERVEDVKPTKTQSRGSNEIRKAC